MNPFKFFFYELWYTFIEHEIEMYERTIPDAELHGWWKALDILFTILLTVTNLSCLTLIVMAFLNVHRGNRAAATDLFLISLAAILFLHLLDWLSNSLRAIGDSRNNP